MAITATVVETSPHRMRFLLQEDAATASALVISNAALLAALSMQGGPIAEIIKSGQDGIGTVAAGALTQATSRDILSSDGSGGSVGNASVPRAVMTLTARSGARSWAADADVDGGGLPTISVASGAGAATDNAYLDINVRFSEDL